MPTSFKVGDLVTWISQANGSTMCKTGEIVAIVPAGVPASGIASQLLPTSASRGRIGYNVGPRDHESYVVRVRHATYYWPLVKNLAKAKA